MISKIVTIMMAMGVSIIPYGNIISSYDSAPITIGSGVMYLNATNQTHSIEWDAT